MRKKEKVLTEAKKWVGYLEKNSDSKLESFSENAGKNNYTIFAKKYCEYGFGAYGVYQGQPWCAMAVTVIFYDALGKKDAKRIIEPYAYCPSGVNHWKSKGRWHPRKGYTPQAGDIIFFHSGANASHTGIVCEVTNGTVYTYEGNTSSGNEVIANGGAFVKKGYNISNERILGYGNPDWDLIEEDIKMEEFKDIKNHWAKQHIEDLHKMGVVNGDNNGNYNPEQPVTRAEAAVMVRNAIRYITGR